MYCENCGKQAQPGDKFCEGCGSKLERPAGGAAPAALPAMQSEADPTPSAAVKPRQPMSKKNKILFGSIGGAAVALAAAFLILRMTYGPSTPEELAKQLNAAVDAQNAAEIAGYLDDSSSPLLAADRIEAFNFSLKDENARKAYKSGILNAISIAEEQAYASESANTFSDTLREELEDESDNLPVSWMTFSKESSWRGEKWSVHITPITLRAEPSDYYDALSSSIKLGALASDGSGNIENLWPSTYTYTGALSSDYGSQNYEGTFDAYDHDDTNIVYFDTSVLYTLGLEFPPFEAKVTLNGKEVAGNPGDYLLFQAVPQQTELAISAEVYGVELSGQATLDVSVEDEYVLEEMLRAPAAEKAADLAYASLISWAEATNAGDASLLKGYDPEGSFSDYITWEMNHTPDVRLALKQIQLDPSSLYFNEDYLSADVSLVYLDNNSWGYEESDSLNLQFARRPGQNEWWIQSHSSTYMYENESNLKRENANYDAEIAKLAPSDATIESSEEPASGDVSFTVDDAQAFMSQYASASVMAINGRDFDSVSDLMDPAGPAYQETSDYIGYLETKGITEEFIDAVVTGFEDNGDSTYNVYTTETYIIYNKDNEGTQRSYNSVYKLSVLDGQLHAHTLISTDEIE